MAGRKPILKAQNCAQRIEAATTTRSQVSQFALEIMSGQCSVKNACFETKCSDSLQVCSLICSCSLSASYSRLWHPKKRAFQFGLPKLQCSCYIMSHRTTAEVVISDLAAADADNLFTLYLGQQNRTEDVG